MNIPETFHNSVSAFPSGDRDAIDASPKDYALAERRYT
jgi:hypothetical protein